MTRLIKTPAEIALIREGGQHLSRILETLQNMVAPGITTEELETVAVDLISQIGGRPAFKGYRPDAHTPPFPSALCTAINEEIVHAPAVPARTLSAGSIITLDIGMEYPYQSGKKGYFTDMAITVPVGSIPKATKILLQGTAESLEAGIALIKPGLTLLELGTAIEKVLKKYKLGVITELVGHGVGFDVHEEPQIPNYAFRKGEFPEFSLAAGMVIAVEPMATLGGWKIAPAADGFTYITADQTLAAHFEHTILVTEEGSEVLTRHR